MRKNITLVTIAALTSLMLASCKTGPDGPDPGQELVVAYKSGGLGIYQELQKSADIILSGDSIRMTFFYCVADTLKGAEAQFDAVTISAFSDPDIVIRFKGGVPSAPGEFTWEPTKFNNNVPPTNADINTGVIIRMQGDPSGYFPVEGKTVVTEVRKNGDGTIAGLAGYFNGKLRRVWPIGFKPSSGQMYPPGYDPANPSLVGEHMTVHSCVFRNRSNSAARPSGGGQ